MGENVPSFELPGFRFKPTEEELLSFYLKNMVNDKKMHLDIIGFLNIYQHDPRELPGLAKIGEREWYFFVPRDRKLSNGGRPNRTTKHGYWKATGSDRRIISLSEPKRVIGLRKTLVFYQGRAPRGIKTDWVMNEYRLPDNSDCHKDIVLCKVYRKATSMKELEERAAKEEETRTRRIITTTTTTTSTSSLNCPTSPFSSSLSNGTTLSSSNDGLLEDFLTPMFIMPNNDSAIHTTLKREDDVDHKFEDIFGSTHSNNSGSKSNNNIQLPFGKESLGELQVPKMGMDWAQDPILSLSLSPWLENLLNFSSPTLMSQFLST